MIKSDILKLFSSFIVKDYGVQDGEIKNISSELQTATNFDVVFYKLNSGEKSSELFLERLNLSKASLVIVNRSPLSNGNFNDLIVLEENSFRSCLKDLVDEFYPYDLTSNLLVGITGTNGKTTTANLAMQIASLLGKPSLCIGTLGIQAADKVISSGSLTTPSYIEFKKDAYKYFKDYKAIFFEFSSHALDQGRLFDLKLDVAGWTNLSQDHLDYHNTMEHYFDSKLKIVTEHLKEDSDLIISRGDQLKELLKNQKIIESKTLAERGITDFPPFFKAEFNQHNLELALEINEKLWGEFPAIDLNKLQPPKGRFSILEKKQNYIIVDFAHTPDALENIILSVRNGFPKFKLNVVFGCGGDRDSSKRSEMGRVVSRNLKEGKIYLTSDNPRFEDPLNIIKDIEPGLRGAEYVVEPERKKAIELALSELQENEILLVAGKGHEEYQDIKGVKYPFSDFNIVENFFSEFPDV